MADAMKLLPLWSQYNSFVNFLLKSMRHVQRATVKLQLNLAPSLHMVWYAHEVDIQHLLSF